MNTTLRYVPPIKGSFLVLVLISFSGVALALYLLFIKFGILVIILFTVFYALMMVYVFISLSQGYYIQIDEEKRAVIIHKTFKSIEINLDIIDELEIIESKKAYLLSIATKNTTTDFSLSGSLSFEEPPLIPFLEKLRTLKPALKLGPFCEASLHGASKFNPWSSKMYYSYWTYIIVMIAYYLFLLLFINILK